MAGGKETPRQKLINLMYLVLLALLALQVGAEIMVKFLQLNNSLEQSNKITQAKSEEILVNIKTNVAARGIEEEKKVEMMAVDISDKADKVIADIEKLKEEMVKESGERDPETNIPLGMKDTDIASVMFLGDKKGTKKGKAFEQSLDDFIADANKLWSTISEAKGGKADPKHYPSLTLDGKEDPQFMNDEEQKNKKFLELAFDHAPMISALAILTERQSQVANIKKDILDKLSGMVGATDLKFDQVVAMVSADAKVVAAGTKYQADLFVSGKSSQASKSEYFLNGKQIETKDGLGKIEIKATYAGGKVDPKTNLMKKSYTGTIKTQGKEITQTFDYYVAKPVLQVQSAAISSLYKNCGNELNITCPALGSNYNPVFSVTGASKREGKGGAITIIPNKPTVKLTVKSDGIVLGTLDFKVGLVPRPEIKAYAKGKEVDQKRGMKAPGPRSIDMKAIADESFARLLPKDARYRVTNWEAILVRGKRPVAKKSFGGPDGNLSSFAAAAKPGDRILIEVKEVRRMTYTGGTEAVSLGTIIMNIPLTD